MRVYLGPYVECTYREATKEVDVCGCTSPTCSQYANRSQWSRLSAQVKFCSCCGSTIGLSKKTIPDKPSRFDVVQDELRSLNEYEVTEQVLLAPNIINSGLPRPFNLEDVESSVHLDMATLTTSAQEIVWFHDRYADALKKLRAAYATVEVKWGLHVTYGGD